MKKSITSTDLAIWLKDYPFKRSMLYPKNQAAVALILRQKSAQTLELLMIQRAIKEDDPWSGHMAFPGGKRNSPKEQSIETAIRETKEETGITLLKEQCIGRLSDIVTRNHDKKNLMKVTPWVFTLPTHIEGHTNDELTLNHEAQDSCWLPCSLFVKNNRTPMKWPLLKTGPWKYTVNLPSYQHDRKIVWGLSLMMIDELSYVVKHKGTSKFSFMNKLNLYFS